MPYRESDINLPGLLFVAKAPLTLEMIAIFREFCFEQELTFFFQV